MLIGIIVFIGLSLLILGHEAGHFFVARLFKLRIDEFGFGFPPRIMAWKRGETEYSLNWLPFGGFVRIAGEQERLTDGDDTFDHLSTTERKRLFPFQPAWRRSIVILAGVAINFIIGWLLLSTIFMVGTKSILIVAEVQEGSPAAQAGMIPGDVLPGYASAEEFVTFTDMHRGESVELPVMRAEESLTLVMTPRVATESGEGAIGAVVESAGIPRYGFFHALGVGFLESVRIVQLVFNSFVGMVMSLLTTATLPGEVAGPVGIFVIAQETGKLGFIYLAHLIALISLNLTVLNLMPFPALDGGRFLFILIEKLKGSPISFRTEAIMNGVGFLALIFLIVSITIRDIARLL